MLSRSLPACPTNGSPFASSSAPGPSPTNSQSASGSPTPGTLFLRPRWSPPAVPAPTSAAKAPPPRRVPGCPRRAISRPARAPARQGFRHAKAWPPRRIRGAASGGRMHHDRTPHDQRVFANRAFLERRVIALAATHGNEAFGGIQRDRCRVGDTHLEEDLLRTETPRIIDEPAQKLAAQSLAPRVRHDGQIQDLRFT